MDAGELIAGIKRNLFQRRNGRAASFGQSELRLLANAHVGMGQKAGQLFQRALSHSFGEQTPRFQDKLIMLMRGIVEAIDSAFARHVPTLDPIAEVKRSIDTEL